MNENAFVVIMRFVSRGRVRYYCILTPRSISLFLDAQGGAIYNVGTIGSIQQCQLTGNRAVRTQWLIEYSMIESLGRIFHELNEHRVFVLHYICVVCVCVWTNSSCISSIKSHTLGQQINVHHIPWCRRPTSWNGAGCKSRVLYTRESLVCVREEQVVYYSMNDEMNENAFVVIVMRFVSRGRVRCDCTLIPLCTTSVVYV